MGNSLKDELLKAGLVSEDRARDKGSDKGAGPRKGKNKRARGKVPRSKPRQRGSDGEPTLAEAYAARARAEREERERQRREQAERRARNARIKELAKSAALNDPEAEVPRYFHHRNRITRIFVTEAQQKGLTDGELAIVAGGRRYYVVPAATAHAVAQLSPEAVLVLNGQSDGARSGGEEAAASPSEQ